MRCENSNTIKLGLAVSLISGHLNEPELDKSKFHEKMLI